jgi:hypothetical protein
MAVPIGAAIVLYSGPTAWATRSAAREDAARTRAIADRIEGVLAGAAFDADAVAALARRDLFPDALHSLICLTSTNRRDHISAILLERHTDRVLPSRLGQHFGIYAAGGSRVRPIVTADSVREKLKVKRHRGAAAVVLALLGELPKWREATRRVRAAYALGLLVRVFKGEP